MGWPRRSRDPDRALPELAELVARGLRSGQSLATALRTAGRELDRELTPSFSVALGPLDHGRPVGAACRDWAARAPSAGREMFAAVVELTAQLGGHAAPAFDALAAALRARAAARREAVALSTQARLSAVIIGVLPLVLGAAVLAADPATARAATAPGASRAGIAAGVACQVIGWCWIRRLTRWTR